jgi:hypothetical protein
MLSVLDEKQFDVRLLLYLNGGVLLGKQNKINT